MIIMENKEPLDKDSISKPRNRRAKRRSWRMPLLEFALLATIAGAASYKFCPKESTQLRMYKNGTITMKDLPVDDKFTIWRDRLSKGACRENFDQVKDEVLEEYYLQLRLGNKHLAKKIFLELEFYISDKIEVEKEPECQRKKKF